MLSMSRAKIAVTLFLESEWELNEISIESEYRMKNVQFCSDKINGFQWTSKPSLEVNLNLNVTKLKVPFELQAQNCQQNWSVHSFLQMYVFENINIKVSLF